MKKSVKIKKLPDSFKRYNYFQTSEVKKIVGEKSYKALGDWLKKDCFNGEVRVEKIWNHNYFHAHDLMKYLYPEASVTCLYQMEAIHRFLLTVDSIGLIEMEGSKDEFVEEEKN